MEGVAGLATCNDFVAGEVVRPGGAASDACLCAALTRAVVAIAPLVCTTHNLSSE